MESWTCAEIADRELGTETPSVWINSRSMYISRECDGIGQVDRRLLRSSYSSSVKPVGEDLLQWDRHRYGGGNTELWLHTGSISMLSWYIFSSIAQARRRRGNISHLISRWLRLAMSLRQSCLNQRQRQTDFAHPNWGGIRKTDFWTTVKPSGGMNYSVKCLDRCSSKSILPQTVRVVDIHERFAGIYRI